METEVTKSNQPAAIDETMLTDHISKRASAYGIEGITVDGNDAEAVWAAARDASARIRNTKKPILLETYTYRLSGHFEPDDMAYVDPEELAEWKSKDPISRLKAKMLESKALTSNDAVQMEQRVQRAISDAVSFAKASPFPESSQLTTDVYA